MVKKNGGGLSQLKYMKLAMVRNLKIYG